MKIYDIWSEGYSVTGNCSPANFFGSIQANSFQEACDKLFLSDDDHKRYYDPHELNYGGCKLFDNETDARHSFG